MSADPWDGLGKITGSADDFDLQPEQATSMASVACDAGSLHTAHSSAMQAQA